MSVAQSLRNQAGCSAFARGCRTVDGDDNFLQFRAKVGNLREPIYEFQFTEATSGGQKSSVFLILATDMRKLNHEEIASQRISPESESTSPRHPIIAIIDSVRSLYNIGSIFRTSDGSRIEKLILTGYSPRPPRKEIEKTALGATATVPWEYVRDPLQAISDARKAGYRICVLEHTDCSVPHYSLTSLDFPICLVVGNEITGVSSEIVSLADCAIEIPMYGMKQSLNVAVAYGIAVFELVRILKQEV